MPSVRASANAVATISKRRGEDAKWPDLKKLRMYKLCYLATPYTKFPGGIHIAFVEASRFAAKLMEAGISVYSPIAHTHPLAIYGNVDPLNHNIWLPFDEAMMNVSDALLVAQMPTWEISKGIQMEIDHFEDAKKDIHYLPDDTSWLTESQHLRL